MIKHEGEITEKLILEIIAKYESENLERFKKLSDYYQNKNAILKREKADGEANNPVCNNYAGYITDMSVGYFIGRPVTYSGKEEMLEVIQDILNYNDEQDINSEIAQEVSIKGWGYEIVYLDGTDLDDKGIPRLRFNFCEPDNMVCVYDYGIAPEMVFSLRWYNKKETRIIELYTRDRVLKYNQNGKKLTLVEETEHFFGIVPVVEYRNNKEGLGDFEKILTLIDAYDKAESESINNLEYFADSYLYLVGMKETDQEDIEKMKKMRVLLLDEKGQAGFLTKEENSQETESITKRLNKDIHKFAMVPDLSDENFANNQSGIAMIYKLLGLEQLTVKKERKMKKALQRRLEIITNYLNIRGNHFDYRDITMNFVRNIPVDDKENVEIVQMLQGIISKKTALSKLKCIEDVSEELENIEEEKTTYQKRTDLDE